MKLLENSTIRLRAIEPEDLEYLFRWENDTTLWQHGCTIAPYSRYEIKEYIAQDSHDLFTHKQLRFMIETKANSTVVGTIDLYDYDPIHQRVGVGIMIDHDFRQKGFAKQSIGLLRGYVFSFLGLHQMYAHIAESNKISLAIFNQSGFECVAKLPEWIRQNNVYETVHIFQMLNK
jgi:diamine N-acetyltransferase